MSEQRLTLDDLTVGQHFESGKHTVDVNEIKAFAARFDPQSFHLDEDAPRRAQLQSTQVIFGRTLRPSASLEKLTNGRERGLGTAGQFELDLGRQIADL